MAEHGKDVQTEQTKAAADVDALTKERDEFKALSEQQVQQINDLQGVEQKVKDELSAAHEQALKDLAGRVD